VELFLKIKGSFLKIHGPQLDFGQVPGFFAKCQGFFQLGNYFPTKNLVDRVHDAWTGWTRRCLRGAHWSTSGGREVARWRRRSVAA
jgi:hypothetical protein